MASSLADDPLIDDPRVADAILQFLEAREANTSLNEETWISSHPEEIRPALQSFLVNRAIVARAKQHTTPSVEQLALSPFGSYRDFAFIAQGGMGAIYRGRDTRLERPIAIKVLHQRLMKHSDMPLRFKAEAQVAAQLVHPNIAPVHETGELPDGRPYFTMKLVEGDTLSVAIREYHANSTGERFERLLRDFVSICDGVEFAHSRGVLHRDLKPINVMIGKFGEVQVMDWGLTKVLGPSTSEEDLTRSVRTTMSDGESQPGVRGTPAYMPPEQAEGSGYLDARCDVFALGAILCQILIGRPPYISDNPDPQMRTRELLDQAQRGDTKDCFAQLDTLGEPAELIALCKKCLAFDRNQRPASVKAVGDAVTRYQANVQQRVQEAEVGRARAEAKASAERRKRQWQLSTAAAILVAVFAGVGGWTWHSRQQEKRREQATREILVTMAKAEEMRNRIRRLPAESLADQAVLMAGWKEGLATVESAVGLARTNDIDPATRAAVSELHAQFQTALDETQARIVQLERETNLVDGLRRAVLQSSVVNLFDLHFDTTVAIRSFVSAFRDYGIDIRAPQADALGVHLRAESPTVQAAVAEALNVWWFIDKDGRPHLEPILDALEDDAWRRSFRSAVERGDADEVKKFALAPNLSTRHAEFIGLVLPHIGAYDESIVLLKRAVFKNPNDFGLQMALGINLQQGRANFRDVAGCFQAAVALGPTSSIAYENLATAQKWAGLLTESEESFGRAFELDPLNVRALCGIAWIKMIRGDYASVERIGKRALGIQPDNAEALAVTSIACTYLIRIGEAKDLLKRVPESSRGQFPPMYARFVVLAQSGKIQEAVAIGKEIAKKHQETDIGTLIAALVATFEGDSRAGESFARQFVAQNRGGMITNIARLLLSGALTYQGRLNEAEKEARTVLNNLGDGFQFGQAVLYEILERQGRFAEALQAAEKLKDASMGNVAGLLIGPTSRLRRLVISSYRDQEKDIERMAAGTLSPPTGAAFDPALVALLTRRSALALLMYRRSLDTTFGKLMAGARGWIGRDEGMTQRVFAARAAALVAGGEGLDAANATELERQSARADALKWLKTELGDCTRMAKQSSQSTRVRRFLIYLQCAPDFAALRDPTRLSKIPEAEQKEWRQFWSDADVLFNSLTPHPMIEIR